MAAYETITDLIDGNLDFLIEKTSDRRKFLTLLFQNKVISPAEREDIIHLLGDRKQNEQLWTILSQKDEDIVPKIIEYLDKTSCAKSVAQLFVNYSQARNNPKPASQNEEQNGTATASRVSRVSESFYLDDDDFVVEDHHLEPLVDLVHARIRSDDWAMIKNRDSFITQKMRNEIGDQKTMKLDMKKSFQVWKKNTPKESRLFSIIVDAFKQEAIDIAELLEGRRAEWKALPAPR